MADEIRIYGPFWTGIKAVLSFVVHHGTHIEFDDHDDVLVGEIGKW